MSELPGGRPAPSSTRRIRKSLTLVPVGPVTNRASRAANQAALSFAASAAAAPSASSPKRRRPRRWCRRARPCPRRGRRYPACPAAASAYSRLGPPRPLPVTVTVSSPPEMRAVPGGESRAIRAWARPISRASPSFAKDDGPIAEPLGLLRRRGHGVGGAGDDAELPSARFGVSVSGAVRPWRSRIARASATWWDRRRWGRSRCLRAGRRPCRRWPGSGSRAGGRP